MKRFKDFVVEEFIQESLDSEFDVKHHNELKDYINNTSKGKLYPEHTSVMGSEHMQNQGMHVLRIMNKDKEIEYHLLNTGSIPGKKLTKDRQDNRATLHAMKIIHDDAKFHLRQGRKVKIQSANARQYKIYTGIANRLIKNDPDRKITQLGMQPRTDGEGKARTLVIESVFEGKSNWISGLGKSQENTLKKACWKGYTAVGTKKKNGKIVPNCVPDENK